MDSSRSKPHLLHYNMGFVGWFHHIASYLPLLKQTPTNTQIISWWCLRIATWHNYTVPNICITALTLQQAQFPHPLSLRPPGIENGQGEFKNLLGETGGTGKQKAAGQTRSSKLAQKIARNQVKITDLWAFAAGNNICLWLPSSILHCKWLMKCPSSCLVSWLVTGACVQLHLLAMQNRKFCDSWLPSYICTPKHHLVQKKHNEDISCAFKYDQPLGMYTPEDLRGTWE